MAEADAESGCEREHEERSSMPEVHRGGPGPVPQSDTEATGGDGAEMADPDPAEKSAQGAEKTEKDQCDLDLAGKNSKLRFDEPVYKTLSLMNGRVNRMKIPKLQETLQELSLNGRGVIEILRKRLKNYYRRRKLAQANVDPGNEERFDFVLAFDVEVTSHSDSEPDGPRSSEGSTVEEIIELSAALVDVTNTEIVSTFREFCRPVVNTVLSDKCKSFTGITQREVDAARAFPEVLGLFERWMADWGLGTSHTFLLVTDGPWVIHYDLRDQCTMSQLPMPGWCERWMSISKIFANFYHTRRACMHVMLRWLGMYVEGMKYNSALEDSKNVARVLCQMLEDGCSLHANEALARDRPPPRYHPACTICGSRPSSSGFSRRGDHLNDHTATTRRDQQDVPSLTRGGDRRRLHSQQRGYRQWFPIMPSEDRQRRPGAPRRRHQRSSSTSRDRQVFRPRVPIGNPREVSNTPAEDQKRFPSQLVGARRVRCSDEAGRDRQQSLPEGRSVQAWNQFFFFYYYFFFLFVPWSLMKGLISASPSKKSVAAPDNSTRSLEEADEK